MKKFIGILAVLILLGTVYFLFTADSNGNANQGKLEFKTTKVQKGDLEVKISATGVVEPNFKVEVKSKASGEVLSFPFEEGDWVKKGKLLLQLDKSDEIRNVAKSQADMQSSIAMLKKAETSLLLQKTTYKTDLRTALSEVLEAEANLKESQDKLKRQLELFEKKFASQEILDAAKTAFKVNQENLIQAKARLEGVQNSIYDIALRESEVDLAQAEVKRSEIALEEAKERLEETEIYAPITGTIIDKMIEEGQIISSGISNVSGGTALVTIADMKRLYIVADVDETDIGAIRPHQPVMITADAFPGRSFKGKVTRIAPQGKVEESITIFKVKLEILGSGKEILKPMMTANVDIINEKLKDVIYVAREAVSETKGKKFSAILENGLPKEIPITTGIQNPIHVQVVSGLEPNQEVLVGDWKTTLEEHEKRKDKSSTVRRILFLLSSKSK